MQPKLGARSDFASTYPPRHCAPLLTECSEEGALLLQSGTAVS